MLLPTLWKGFGMTDTPVTDTSLEAVDLERLDAALERMQPDRIVYMTEMIADETALLTIREAAVHIAELIRTGRIRLGGGE